MDPDMNIYMNGMKMGMNMDIDFELYKIFYHAAKSGSFSAAAQKLFITQSAVSQAIKKLATVYDFNI